MSKESFDLILTGGRVHSPNGPAMTDVGVRDGKIAAFGDLSRAAAAERIALDGLDVLPGVIDTQVHFREPGLEHKEDLASGTAAAALGGVVAVFEMPNTSPSTLDAADLADKLKRASGRAWVDHAFFMGAAAENADALAVLEKLPGCCGVKIFMGSSTGSLLVDDGAVLDRVLGNGLRRVAVHAEDEARLRERLNLVRDAGDVRLHPHWRDVETAVLATRRLLETARRNSRRIHVLHVTTAEEVPLLAANKDIATMEVTPQHLTLVAPDCYEEWGTLAQMNPPIREKRHRDALWQALRDGVVDVIGSDHAPHTREEKAHPHPTSPSGLPGVQTLVPLMLDHVAAGNLTLARFIDLTSAGPARIFGIAGKGRIARGYDADFTVVDLEKRWQIEADWLAYKCGWSPFEGRKITGQPKTTIVRGHVVMRDGELTGPARGVPVRFLETLAT